MSKTPRTLADFRALHDPATVISNKIKSTLLAMYKEGPEQWEYESDFVKRAGLSNNQIGGYRDQFADHVVETPSLSRAAPRRIWFADAKIARKVRGE
jgi:hypothetical protein